MAQPPVGDGPEDIAGRFLNQHPLEIAQPPVGNQHPLEHPLEIAQPQVGNGPEDAVGHVFNQRRRDALDEVDNVRFRLVAQRPVGNGPEDAAGHFLNQHPLEIAQPLVGNGPDEAVGRFLNQQRLDALDEVDNAGFSRFHFKVGLVAGVGFFTDAYDLFAINIASYMLGYLYGPGGSLSSNQDLGIKVASIVGNLFGQLLFGWLADIVGRKRMYGVELCIIIVATFSQAIAGQADTVDIIAVLIVWRFVMGIGIGGDYPLSAVISSEFASTSTRGRLMTGVFAAQGWGQFTAALVSVVVVTAFKSQISNDDPTHPRHVDFCWRILIGLGCIPAAIALYFRLTIPETPRFTMDVERNICQAVQDVNTFLTTGTFVVDPDAVVQRAAAPRASRGDFMTYFGRWDNALVLFGTSYSWFALDFAFYGLGLNNSIILQAIGFGSELPSGGSAVYQTLINISVGNLILSVAGFLPGYYVALAFIDFWGRKPIQLMGFIVLTIIFIIMGFGYHTILNNSKGAFVFLYCLANFFQNFGPNTTTFIIPGEAFPTRYRSTGHGISAASGKLGAIIAQVAFQNLKDRGGKDQFLNHILEIFALFMLSGVFSTLLVPETMRRTLEDISNESQDNFIQGIAAPVELQELQAAQPPQMDAAPAQPPPTDAEAPAQPPPTDSEAPAQPLPMDTEAPAQPPPMDTGAPD